MTKANEIIEHIRENGGLDMEYIERCARQDGVTCYEYLYDYIKKAYNCHGNTARVVANYFL